MRGGGGIRTGTRALWREQWGKDGRLKRFVFLHMPLSVPLEVVLGQSHIHPESEGRSTMRNLGVRKVHLCRGQLPELVLREKERGNKPK